MKKLIFSILAITLLLPVLAFSDRVNYTTVSYDQVVNKVSSENLAVYKGALKVYQAKKSISVARGNLLPKLNIWRILSIPFDPRESISVVEDLAPFLIPANWFQLKASKDFYNAEVEGYKALWANEVMTAKSLYLQLLYDRTLFQNIKMGKEEMDKILVIIKTRELLGELPPGTSREVEVRMLALDEDARSLQMLIEEEATLLAQMLGYPVTTKLELKPVELVDFEKHTPLQYEDYEARVLKVSPELRQYGYLVHASTYVRKEAYFSLFGIGTLSRGVAGGVFDNVPIQDGLGFGTPASVKIARSQTAMLTAQKQGASETLKRQLQLVVTNYNLRIANFGGIKKRVSLTRAINDQLYERLTLGENVEMLSLLEGSRNLIQAQTSFTQAQYHFLMEQDKVMRLTLNADYSRNPLKK